MIQQRQQQWDFFDGRRRSIQEQYAEWRQANPEIWDHVRRYAYEALQAGRSRFGIAMIVERVRWYTMVESAGDDLKVNNNWRSRMTRELIAEDPRFEDLFETRQLKTP